MGMISALANGLQVAGLILIAVGGWLIFPWLGLILAGVSAVLVGFALER
jgi:hypothetical protein